MDLHSACLLLLTCLAGLSASETEEGGIQWETSYGPSSVEIHGVRVVTVGIPYGFLCTAQCEPGCTFLWTRGNVTSEGPEISLQLLHREPTQTLTCTVHNPTTGRSASAHRTLQVTVGPSNVQIRGPTFMTAGTLSTFTCSANCYPACSYSWTVSWEGEALRTAQGDTITFKPAASTVLSESLTCMAEDTVSHLYISTTTTLPVASVSEISIAGDRTVTMGKHYTFSCYVACVPSCSSITWTYMGKTFQGQEVELPIYHQGKKKKSVCQLGITLSDYSKTEPLTCTATNSISMATINSTVYLTVIDPFSVRPSQALAVANTSFSLRCLGSENPASITWLKDKRPVPASSRVRLSPKNITLTFSPLLPEDGGLYQCVVTEGPVPLQSVGYDMQVNYGPTSVVISGVNIMTLGMSYEFQCSAECYPACRFTWTWEGKTSEGPKLNLTLKDPRPTQTLSCTAVNPATSASLTLQKTLQVIAGPTNVRISGPSFLTAGVTSVFSCSADCSPSCSYRWRISFQQEPVGSARGKTISVTPLASVFYETLICVAQDDISHLYIEASVQLPVARVSNVNISGPAAVAMGKRYTYTCSAVCSPSCTYTWTFMGKTLETERLDVTVSEYSNVETLTCQARNTLSNATVTATMNLTVIDPFSVRPASQAPPVAGKSFSLRCVGPQDPTSITWLKDKRQIPASARVHFSADNTSVTFSSLMKQDGGLYQCLVVEGGNRTVHHNALVVEVEGGTPILSVGYLMQVNYGPNEVFIVKPNKGPVGELMFAQPGSTTELKCVTDCFPACLIAWFYNNVTVSTNATIFLSPVAPPYANTLICVAFNPTTNQNRSALTEVVVPNGPNDVTINGPETLEIGVTAKFSCSAVCYPPCSFTWTLFGKTVTGSELDITVNRHVSKETISCQAQNTFTGKTATLNETLAVSDPQWCGC